MGDFEIITNKRGRLVVFYLDNPFPLHQTGIDIYPNGTALLYDRGNRLVVHDRVYSGVPIDKTTVEHIDRGRTLVVEVEAVKDKKRK